MIWSKLGICICFALAGESAMATQVASARPIGGSLEGEWGGDRLQLVIDSNGGRVEMDCASGTIKGPITLSSNGTFLAVGTFEQHQGGPQRADEEPAAASARYSGEVKDHAMRLKIQSAGAHNAQEFNLRKGVRVKLIRCR